MGILHTYVYGLPVDNIWHLFKYSTAFLTDMMCYPKVHCAKLTLLKRVLL